MLTTLFVDLSAVNLEGVQKYAELLAANVDIESWDCDASEKQVETTEGPNGSYAVGRVTLRVETDKLNTCLVQIDAVNDGCVEDEEDVLDMIFGDARVEVVVEEGNEIAVLKQQNLYLHNKIQEQNRNYSITLSQFNGVLDAVGTNTMAVQAVQRRYEMLQTYLHSYVNVNGLVKTVQQLAEAVDPDLLEDLTLHTIH
jgi:hypothetical protein